MFQEGSEDKRSGSGREGEERGPRPEAEVLGIQGTVTSERSWL